MPAGRHWAEEGVEAGARLHHCSASRSAGTASSDRLGGRLPCLEPLRKTLQTCWRQAAPLGFQAWRLWSSKAAVLSLLLKAKSFCGFWRQDSGEGEWRRLWLELLQVRYQEVLVCKAGFKLGYILHGHGCVSLCFHYISQVVFEPARTSKLQCNFLAFTPWVINVLI